MSPGSSVQKIPVVLITGASRGLGRGVAEACARAGYTVGIHFGRNHAAAEQTASACRALAREPRQQFATIQGDIACSDDRTRIFEETLGKFGRLDALVNNAGMAPRIRADLTETTEASYDELLAVNLKGPHFLSQLAARHWLSHPGEAWLPAGYTLLFVSSISADTASTNRGEYCISKAGLAMSAQLWAARLAGEGIQVFELRPGIMRTDMTAVVKDKYDKLIGDGLVPQRRWGMPDDLGSAVVSILQGAFPFSTGAVIPVDGGLHLRRL